MTDKPKVRLATLRLIFWALSALTYGLLVTETGWAFLPVAVLALIVWRWSVEQLRVVAADDPWKYFFATSDLLRSWPVFYVLVGLPLSLLIYWAPPFIVCQYVWSLWWFTVGLELYLECRVLETMRWAGNKENTR